MALQTEISVFIKVRLSETDHFWHHSNGKYCFTNLPRIYKAEMSKPSPGGHLWDNMARKEASVFNESLAHQSPHWLRGIFLTPTLYFPPP